ncbi:hypothetical protein Hanom_Chr08g00758441 [Helianthus anomalus]
MIRSLTCIALVMLMEINLVGLTVVIDQSFRSSCKQAGSCFGKGMFRLSVSSMNQVNNSLYGFRTADLELICCMCA